MKNINVLGKQETLCWSCKKSKGHCTWSSSLTPVKGWDAQKTPASFFVRDCPLFEEDAVSK